MSATFRRVLLTNKLLEVIGGVTWPNGDAIKVGDMETPKGVGWSGTGPDQPGSHFVAYYVLTPLVSMPAGGPLAASQADWHVTYALQSYGVGREQCETMSGMASAALNTLVRTRIELDDAEYLVQQVASDSLGAVERVPGTNPAYFGMTDQATVWVSKNKSRRA